MFIFIWKISQAIFQVNILSPDPSLFSGTGGSKLVLYNLVFLKAQNLIAKLRP